MMVWSSLEGPLYIIHKAAAYLAESKITSGGQDIGGWGLRHQIFEAKAEMEFSRLNKSVENNTKKIEGY